ncbi:MAG TPA: DUF1501 domain-containing protein [Planctomycetaceae bacterium]|jgi:hypothetical protein|nr:DUF1501 domain-containing protein [Planctomycetaceae bacterium]
MTIRTSMATASESLSRRDLLRTAGALGLSFLLPPLEARAANERGVRRKKSLVTIWLEGGPSQLETWDPHPGTKIGGPTKAISTSIPGVQIADTFPTLAAELSSLSVIRSLVSKEGDHERGSYFLKTGYRPDPTLRHPSLGAILVNQIPDASLVIPQHIAIGNSQWPPRGGFLGDQLDAFRVYDPGRDVPNLKAPVEAARQTRRVSNLEVVSRAFERHRQPQVEKTLHQHMIERALEMMSSDQLRAFQIEGETRTLRDAYGDTTFGRGCLVARRLVEAGIRAVEITLSGFDTHANNFNGHRENARILDPALATLLRDLRERDLLQSTVVLVIGEFGRSPAINPLDGRDHWPSGFSCLVGGGGLKSGLAIGSTDPQGREKMPHEPVEVADLFATIFKTFGVDFGHEVITPIGRPMAFSSGKPISRLLS